MVFFFLSSGAAKLKIQRRRGEIYINKYAYSPDLVPSTVLSSAGDEMKYEGVKDSSLN